MDKKVSVVIPVFNVDKYIERCMNSILNQTYQNYEVLMIDDGSTDKSAFICDQLAQKDVRIRVIHKENGGVSSARNRGIEEAQGQYIAFVDADDWVEEKYLEYLVHLINCDNVQLGSIGFKRRNDVNDVSDENYSYDKIIQFNRDNALNLILAHEENLGYSCNKIYIRNIIVENNIRFRENIKLWEDLLFCCEYISNIQNISYSKAKLYNYYVREDSATNTPNFEKEMSKVYAAEHIKEVADLQVTMCHMNVSSDFVRLSKWLCAKAYYNVLMYMAKNRACFNSSTYNELITKSKPYFFYLSIREQLCFIIRITYMKIII